MWGFLPPMQKEADPRTYLVNARYDGVRESFTVPQGLKLFFDSSAARLKLTCPDVCVKIGGDAADRPLAGREAVIQ
jgi:hypothetical protein